MLSDAFTFPTRDDDWLKTVAIGGVLSIPYLNFLLGIPAIVVLGYMYRVLAATGEEVPEPPVFDEYVDMFVDGLKMLAVQIAYTIVPGILLMAAWVIGVVAALSGDGGGGLGVTGMLLLVLAVVSYLVAAYLLPAGLANMARNDSIAAAFDVDTLRTAATDRSYAVAVITALVVAGVLGSIAGLLSLAIVGAFAVFYVQIAMFYLYGRGFSKAVAESGGQTSGATAGVSG